MRVFLGTIIGLTALAVTAIRAGPALSNEHSSDIPQEAPSWLRPLGSLSYTDQINNMIAHFDHMGVVEARAGPTSGPFPSVIEVEDLHPAARAVATAVGPRAAEQLDLSGIDKMRRFPHGLRR